MDATTAEAGCFTRRIEARNDLAARSEHAAREVGLESAQGFAGEDIELDADERTVFWIEQAVELRGAADLVA